jgi:hypothetical protein
LDFQYICHQLLKSHNKVFIVTVLRGVKLVAQAKKKGAPMPNNDELNKMYLQGWTMLTQVSSNEPLYGKVESVTISHEKMRALLVPIDQKHYMGIGCAKPCNADTIMKNAERIIAEAKA